MIRDYDIESLLEALSSKDPVPGGGGASALAGALGVSLGAMVISLTLGKKRYADVEEDLQRDQADFDMFREMFLVTGLQKLLLKDPSVTPAYEILKMATVGGAKAMRLENADILAAGKLADIIMIDLNRPNMQPIHDIAKNLVFSGSKENVKMTMINGKILYENGKFHLLNGETPDEIYKTCQEISEKLIALKIRH